MTSILILIGVFTALSILLSDIGWNNVLSPQRNELVFEGRHRAYGAYPQRREHHRVMFLAFTLAIASIGALLILPRLFAAEVPIPLPAPPKENEREITIVIPDHPVKPTTPTPPERPSRSNDGFIPVPVDSMPRPLIDTARTATDPIPTGSGSSGPVDTAATGDGRTGTGTTTPPPPEIRTWVPFMPQFPGGDEALQRFWQNNVNWTSDMLDGEKAVVHIEFVVDVNGRVYDARIAVSAGAQLDAAVLRAMRRMPDWIPGRMGDEEVRVRMTQPVRFKVR